MVSVSSCAVVRLPNVRCLWIQLTCSVQYIPSCVRVCVCMSMCVRVCVCVRASSEIRCFGWQPCWILLKPFAGKDLNLLLFSLNLGESYCNLSCFTRICLPLVISDHLHRYHWSSVAVIFETCKTTEHTARRGKQRRHPHRNYSSAESVYDDYSRLRKMLRTFVSVTFKCRPIYVKMVLRYTYLFMDTRERGSVCVQICQHR